MDESFSTGKGANAVVSMLHYYLQNHGLNSVIIHLNADNCSGQNKNNALLQVSKLHSNSHLYCLLPVVPFMENTDGEK